jgi:hypothetical protein
MTTTTPVTTKTTPRQRVLSALTAAGIAPQSLVRKLHTDTYVADFCTPEWDEPVDPAAVYAEKIKAVFPQARIYSRTDTIAPWRAGEPVLNACVIFEVEHV